MSAPWASTCSPKVLERQPQDVTLLLLRTSILERVSGPLADRLLGGSGSERILWELEDTGAFVVSLDAERSWFRYHHLFADLLGLELRRTAPQELPGLHTIAAEWLAEHGHPVQAIRPRASGRELGYRGAAARGQLAPCVPRRADRHPPRAAARGFCLDSAAADAELAPLVAYDRRAGGFLQDAERYLTLAARLSGSVPEERRGRFEVSLALMGLALARARHDLQMLSPNKRSDCCSGRRFRRDPGDGGNDALRPIALISLGTAEMWAGQLQAAERHLEQGLEEAQRIGQPWLELQAFCTSRS